MWAASSDKARTLFPWQLEVWEIHQRWWSKSTIRGGPIWRRLKSRKNLKHGTPHETLENLSTCRSKPIKSNCIYRLGRLSAIIIPFHHLLFSFLFSFYCFTPPPPLPPQQNHPSSNPRLNPRRRHRWASGFPQFEKPFLLQKPCWFQNRLFTQVLRLELQDQPQHKNCLSYPGTKDRSASKNCIGQASNTEASDRPQAKKQCEV